MKIGCGNSKLVRLRFSLNSHKSAQIENVADIKEAVGLPQSYTLNSGGGGGREGIVRTKIECVIVGTNKMSVSRRITEVGKL